MAVQGFPGAPVGQSASDVQRRPSAHIWRVPPPTQAPLAQSSSARQAVPVAPCPPSGAHCQAVRAGLPSAVFARAAQVVLAAHAGALPVAQQVEQTPWQQLLLAHSPSIRQRSPSTAAAAGAHAGNGWMNSVLQPSPHTMPAPQSASVVHEAQTFSPVSSPNNVPTAVRGRHMEPAH